MKQGDLVYVLMPSAAKWAHPADARFDNKLGIFMGKTTPHIRRYGGQEPIALYLVFINNRIGTYTSTRVKEIES